MRVEKDGLNASKVQDLMRADAPALTNATPRTSLRDLPRIVARAAGGPEQEPDEASEDLRWSCEAMRLDVARHLQPEQCNTAVRGDAPSRRPTSPRLRSSAASARASAAACPAVPQGASGAWSMDRYWLKSFGYEPIAL